MNTNVARFYLNSYNEVIRNNSNLCSFSYPLWKVCELLRISQAWAKLKNHLGLSQITENTDLAPLNYLQNSQSRSLLTSVHIHMIICRVHLDQYNTGSNFLLTHSLIPLHCPLQFKSIKSIILRFLCTTVPGHRCRSPSPSPQSSLISVNTSQVLMNAPICIMHVHYNTLLHPPSLCHITSSK